MEKRVLPSSSCPEDEQEDDVQMEDVSSSSSSSHPAAADSSHDRNASHHRQYSDHSQQNGYSEGKKRMRFSRRESSGETVDSSDTACIMQCDDGTSAAAALVDGTDDMSCTTESQVADESQGQDVQEEHHEESAAGGSVEGGGGGSKTGCIPARESWLLRLFESTLFDMSIAITYLFKSKETGVLSYIGNRMFTFKESDVDFYLFQVVTLYIHHADVADSLHPYLVHRCRESSRFSLQLVWLLNSFFSSDHVPSSPPAPGQVTGPVSASAAIPQPSSSSSSSGSKKKSLGLKLKKLILSEELRSKDSVLIPAHVYRQHVVNHVVTSLPTFKKTHHRSYSDATTARSSSRHPLSTAPLPFAGLSRTLGDLTSGHAFDNGCICAELRIRMPELRMETGGCNCGAPRLAAQHEFVKSLISIGSHLQSVMGKEMKAQRLLAQLSILNLNLPARVWLPIHSSDHLILRIPPGAAVLLNSKDRAPYLVYVEAIDVTSGDIASAPLPSKLINSLRQTKSEENLLKYCHLNHQHVDQNGGGGIKSNSRCSSNGSPIISTASSSSATQLQMCPAVDNDKDCWDDDVSEYQTAKLLTGTTTLPADRLDTISQLSQDSSDDPRSSGSGASASVFVAGR